MTEIKADCYFIVNPRAGSGKTMRSWVPVERQLYMAGFPFCTVMTDHKCHATHLAREAAQKGYRKIVAVGGDGSLHEVFNGICSWCEDNGVSFDEFFLGVIPIGSGNDWIKSLGVPHDVQKASDLIRKGSCMRMDVVRLTSAGGKRAYMANVGGLGFDSHVCKRVNTQKESGQRGRMIYLNALIHTVFNLSAISLCLLADGREVFRGLCYSVALGNGRYSGSGMRQVPRAKLDDGLLDYMIVPKMPISRLLGAAPKLFTGTLDRCDKVISGQCRELQIMPMDSASSDVYELDGEIEGHLPLTVEVLQGQINVMCGRI